MVERIPSSETHHRFGMNEKQWVAFSSVIAAIVLTLTKLVVGLWTNSLGILSEALHSALDLLAAGITLFAVRKSAEPPDRDHHYGHGRVENLSALIETILLLVTVIWIVYEATRRIIFNELVIEVNLLAFGVVIFAIIVDYSRSRALKRVAKKYDSQALEADGLHFSTDILSSSVVFAGLVFAYFGFPLGDPIAAIGVGIVVLYLTIKLGRETIDVLLDRAPAGLVTPISHAIEEIDGIRECGRVRLRKAGPTTFADIVCYVDRELPLASAHEISIKGRKAVEEVIGHADVMIHMDLASKRYPELSQNIRAEAQKFTWISDVESVDTLEREAHVDLVLTLKIEKKKTLAKAHQLVSDFEARLKSLYPFIHEVISHLEPSQGPITIQLEPSEIEAQIHQLVQQNRIFHNCHNLQLNSLASNLYNLAFHCEARPNYTIKEIHTATIVLEDDIREKLPIFSQITIHVEPLSQQSKKKDSLNNPS